MLHRIAFITPSLFIYSRYAWWPKDVSNKWLTRRSFDSVLYSTVCKRTFLQRAITRCEWIELSRWRQRSCASLRKRREPSANRSTLARALTSSADLEPQLSPEYGDTFTKQASPVQMEAWMEAACPSVQASVSSIREVTTDVPFQPDNPPIAWYFSFVPPENPYFHIFSFFPYTIWSKFLFFVPQFMHRKYTLPIITLFSHDVMGNKCLVAPNKVPVRGWRLGEVSKGQQSIKVYAPVQQVLQVAQSAGNDLLSGAGRTRRT